MRTHLRDGLIAVLVFFAARSAAAAIPASEHDALVAFYNATGGSGWSRSDNWLGAAGTECTWHGIGCDDAEATVISIDLHDNQLAGALPSQIGALTSVRDLILYGNQIAGAIPSEIGQLTQLTALYLGNNAFTGAFPSSVGNLKKLQVLDVSGNQLSTLPQEVTSLSSLQELWLAGNRFSGAIPSALGNLSSLTSLDLSYNQYSGSIPDALGSLTNLQTLSLAGNDLTGSIPSTFGNLAALTELRLSENRISGSIPSELGRLNNIELLDLDNNEISGSIPPELGNLTNLQRLWMYNNLLSGSIPTELAKLTNIADLVLGHNQLSGTIPNQFGALPKVVNLWLENNQLTGALPAELTQLTTLEVLGVQGNRLSGTLPPRLLRMPALRTLYASSNLFTGSIPTDIASSNLTDLWLQDNELSGTIPKELVSIPTLRTLYLQENALTGPIPSELTKLTNLGELNLNSNQLTGSIPSSLGQLSNLQVLSLSWNQLSGAMPPELFSLTKLTYLDLAALSLTGSIPSDVGNLTRLEYLFLNDNQLAGSLPASIGNLSHLLQLSVAGNSLSGAVPVELWQLSHLEDLEINDNAFSGTIPTEIGGMVALGVLSLGGNRFTGALPAELGLLTNLRWIDVSANQFSGAVPSQIANLTKLPDGGGNFSYNALYTTDATLSAFLDRKQGSPWTETQTVAATNVTVSDLTDRSAVVSWTPIAYSWDEGGYHVTATPRTSGSPVISTTCSKDQTSLLVRPLQAATTYDFVVRTVTHPHDRQQNLLVSAATASVSGTTTARVNAPADVEVTTVPTGLVQIGGVPQNTDSFVVTNFGDLSTTLTLTVDGTFFQISPTTLTLAGGASQTVTITSVAQQPAGAYDGAVMAAGDGVHDDFWVYVGLLSIAQVAGRAVAEATTSRIEIAGDIGGTTIGSVTFKNSGTATLYGILLSDVPWITVPPNLVVIDPSSSYSINFTVVRSKRPDAGASGTISGSLRLVYVDGSAAGAALAAWSGQATTTPGLSVTTVTVVDTAKPTVSSSSIPAPAAGEVIRFVAGISTMSRTAEQFVTDVSVTNTFGVAPIKDLRMYLTTIGSSGASVAAFASVDPARVVTVSNIARTVYGASSQVGTLHIRSLDWNRMIVNGRLLNQSGKASTVGTTMPVFRSDRSARGGQSIYLPGLRKGTTEHTNLDVQETAGNAATVQIEFLDANGAAVGTQRAADTLAPYGLLELANGVPQGAVTAVVTNRTGSAGNVAAYATVVDEQSGETWTVVDWGRYYDFARNEAARVPFARSIPTTSGGGRRRAVRAAAQSAATDLTLFNPDATSAIVKLRYLDSANASSTQTITLAGRETRTITDVVRTVTGSAVSSYGSIVIDPVRGTFVASSRTYQSAQSEKLGGAGPVVSAAAGLRVGQKQTFARIDDSASSSTSSSSAGQQTGLGLVETGGNAVTVRATMLLSDGKSPVGVVVSRDFKLQPSQVVVYDSIIGTIAAQFTSLSLTELHDLQIELTVIEGSGAVTPFLVVTDPTTSASMIRLE